MAKKNVKIPRGPFPVYKDLGEGIQKTNELLFSMISGGRCLAFTEFLADDAVYGLTDVPEGTLYALIVVEVIPGYGGSNDILSRYRQDGVDPTFDSGMPMGHLGVVEIKGADNLKAFRITTATPGFGHIVRVEYYG